MKNYIITQTRNDAIGIVQENIKQDYEVVNIKWFKFMPLSHLWELIYTPFLARKFKEGDNVLSCNSKSIHTHLLPYFTKAKLYQLHYHFDNRVFALHKTPFFSYEKLFSQFHTIFTNTHSKDIGEKVFLSENWSIVPLGIDHKVFEDLDLPREKYSLLYVGSFGHRKNIDGTLLAFRYILQQYPTATLTICSISDYLEIKDLLEAYNIKDNVIFLGDVSLARLVQEYNKAEVFLFPTFIEGFGLPLVESVACGCKVVTSNTPVHREVTGDLETYVDPSDTESIVNGVKEAFERKKTNQKHAKGFNWANTRQLIKEVINGD